MSHFRDKVLDIVKTFRREYLTYKQVANLAGESKCFTSSWKYFKNNYDPKIPCHRVIRSDGITGEYNRGRENKIKLLKAEGALD